MLEPHRRQQLSREGPSAAPGRSRREGRHLDVLEAREPREQPHVLKRPHDACRRELGGSPRRDVASVEMDRARRRPLEAREDVDERRLAGAVGPDQTEDLAAAHGEIDAVHRLHASDVNADVPSLEADPHGCSFARVASLLARAGLLYARFRGTPPIAVSGHLVGRAEELGAFDLLLAELEAGRAATIQLVGEPGIGKTRLLAELAARVDERGLLVLTGSASELERDLPFWVFVDALDEYLQGLEPRRLGGLDDDVRSELAQVFPSLSSFGNGSGSRLQHERYRSHRAVRELLELLASTKPLVLILDDLHWADAATVELLGALLHRPPAAPVLTALAVRPRQVPERLSAAVERAHRTGSLHRVELGELTRDEAGELLGAAQRLHVDSLYEASGGNPFYLEQLARSLDRAPPRPASGAAVTLAGVEVPDSVAAALTEELGLLSDSARSVLQGAAVAGDPFEPELAAAAAGTSEDVAIVAIDDLLQLDLIRPTDVPRRFRFRHPLVRRAVYEAAPGGWRLVAHERCAEALASAGVAAAVRAHHVEYSARPGDLAAVAVLREAGEAVTHRAPASAERWFSSALRLLPVSAPTEERVELLLAQAGALAATGRFADSHAALVESIAIVPRDAVALRVRLTAACAGVEHLLGRHGDAHARLERTLAELDDPILVRGGGVDGRARHRRAVPGRVRADAGDGRSRVRGRRHDRRRGVDERRAGAPRARSCPQRRRGARRGRAGRRPPR